MWRKKATAFTDERIAAEGQKDGERNIPDMGSYAPAQFEQALIARGEQGVHRIYKKASLRIARLQPFFQICQNRFRDIEFRYHALVDQYKARKSDLGRDLAAPFRYKYHLALILFLGLGEFPLNTIVFRLFGEPEYLTYVMTATLAVTIPLLGLFIGIFLRQSVPPKVGNILIGLLIPASAGTALYAVSMLRNIYIVSQVSQASSAPTNQDQFVFALFSLNALVFCGAMVSSFFSHDPDDRLDHCHKSLIALDRKRNQVRRRLFRIGTKMNGEIKKAKSQIEQIRAVSSERVALYRQTNIRFRRLLPPPSFRRNPEFPKLEWWSEVSLDGGGGHPHGG